MKKEMHHIYLFRHGQTYFNKNKIFTGWKDSKLTALGKKQAGIIAKKLKNKKFEVAFTSDFKRAKDTLKIILKYHPECRKIIIDKRIRERNYGRLNGLSHEKFVMDIGKNLYNLEVEGDAIFDTEPSVKKKIEKLLGEEEYKLIHRGYDIAPPKGESFNDVEKRVKKFIKDLKKFVKKNKVNVAISAHGNSIRLFRKIMEKAPIKKVVKWNIPYDKYFEYKI